MMATVSQTHEVSPALEEHLRLNLLDPPAPHADDEEEEPIAQNQKLVAVDQTFADQTRQPMTANSNGSPIPVGNNNDHEEVASQGVPTNVVIENNTQMAEIKDNLSFKDQARQSQRGNACRVEGNNSGDVQEVTDVTVNTMVQAHLVPPSQLDASPLYNSDASPIAKKQSIPFCSTKVKMRRICSVLLSLTAVVLLCAIVGGVVATIRRRSADANNDLSPPPMVHSVIASIYSLAGSTPPSFDDDTPQGQALAWLENSTTPLLLKNEDRIRIRYALATLFYAMNGEDWIVRASFLSPNVHECDWNFGGTLGVGCNSEQRVSVLSLPNNKVIARQGIPAEMSILTDLRILNLRGDIRDGGTVNVQTNSIRGALPTELGALTHLVQLDLSQNGFISGAIPTEFANLNQLVELRLNDNSFDGTVPEFIGRLSSLTFVSLVNNNLTGDAPTILNNIPCVLLQNNNLTSCFLQRRRRLQASSGRDTDRCFSYTPPCELPAT